MFRVGVVFVLFVNVLVLKLLSETQVSLLQNLDIGVFFEEF